MENHYICRLDKRATAKFPKQKPVPHSFHNYLAGTQYRRHLCLWPLVRSLTEGYFCISLLLYIFTYAFGFGLKLGKRVGREVGETYYGAYGFLSC